MKRLGGMGKGDREEGGRRETYHWLVADVGGNCTYHVGVREGGTHFAPSLRKGTGVREK